MEPIILDDKPAISHAIARLRDKSTPPSTFYWFTETVSTLIISEALNCAPIEEIEIETPLEKTVVKRIQERNVIGIPILRAGIGMARSFQSLLPKSAVYHIGIKRNEETLEPIPYYDQLPEDLEGKTTFILDPMLATAGSAIATSKFIAKRGPEKIVFCGIIGSVEGALRLDKQFPNMPIYLGSLDDYLDKKGYIVPGLGDAGDRIFGT